MLNEHQTSAVLHRDGPCLTLAGPGSGKTTVLIERILRLIETGVLPEEILVITFTKDAAGEMKERFLKKADAKCNAVTFGTFHSIFYRMLTRLSAYKNLNILNERQKLKIFSEVLRKNDIKISSGDILENLLKDISRYLNSTNPRSPFSDELPDEIFLSIVKDYNQRKKDAYFLDFDDMLRLANEEFSNNPSFLQYWQNRFRYFLVDEMQDMNGLQFEAIRKLCASNNLFGVGDDDQSIYGFRGSDPSFMLDFPMFYRGCKIIQLNTNYRSAKKIVQASKQLILHNEKRFVKEIESHSSDDGVVTLQTFSNEFREAERIVSILTKEKNSKKKTAILFRNRHQASVICTLLKEQKIAYFAKETITSIKEYPCMKDLFSYFRLAKDFKTNALKREDILRVMNKPHRHMDRGGLSSEVIHPKEWLSYYPIHSEGFFAVEQFLSQLQMLSSLSLKTGLKFLQTIGFSDEQFDSCCTYITSFPTKEAFFEELQKPVEKKIKEPSADESLFLYTFHASKGLEFDRVFILDCIEGITPSKNAVSQELLEEERRMFYVAMTRAKEELVLCIPEQFCGQKVFASRFIEELSSNGL